MSTVISAEDLGKKYLIRHQPKERYTALRDVLTSKVKQLGGAMLYPVPGSAAGETKTREEFWALRDVDFEIRKGDRVGIIGRNGAGKSTLLKILSRITEPSTGRVKIRGRVASLLEVGTGFHPELTGRENIFLNGAILGMGKAEIERKFDQIVAFSGVETFLDTPVKRFSSGMTMRLAFSVGAHLDPDILIIDEVLAVGDTEFQKRCLEKMEELSRDGRTLLFVSHNLGSISALCDKCMYLERGRLKQFDRTAAVIASYNQVDKREASVEIDPALRVKGNGSIAFKTAALMDAAGEPKTSFLIGEDIHLDLTIESCFEGRMSFWLIIFDSTGRPLLSTHQRDQETVEIGRGRYRLSYQSKGLGLMPGSYTISAGAFDTKLTFLEWIDHFQSFEVFPTFLNGTPFDHRWGMVSQAASWRLGPW
jgi:lipopolysaccharide transport system ATP-binding protein